METDRDADGDGDRDQDGDGGIVTDPDPDLDLDLGLDSQRPSQISRSTGSSALLGNADPAAAAAAAPTASSLGHDDAGGRRRRRSSSGGGDGRRDANHLSVFRRRARRTGGFLMGSMFAPPGDKAVHRSRSSPPISNTAHPPPLARPVPPLSNPSPGRTGPGHPPPGPAPLDGSPASRPVASSPAAAPTPVPAAAPSLDPGQLVQMALSLSDQRRRRASATLAVPVGSVDSRRVRSAGAPVITVAPGSPMGNDFMTAARVSCDDEAIYARVQDIDYQFSPATLHRAERVRAFFELSSEYRRLLSLLPPLRPRAASPPPELGRQHNPLQLLRNRKARHREQRPLDPPQDAFDHVARVRDFVDSVEAEARAEPYRSAPDVSLLPPFRPTTRAQDPPPLTRAHRRTDTAVSKTARPENDWSTGPAELLADAVWLLQGDNRCCIENRHGQKLFPQAPRSSLDSSRSGDRSGESRPSATMTRTNTWASQLRPDDDEPERARGRKRPRFLSLHHVDKHVFRNRSRSSSVSSVASSSNRRRAPDSTAPLKRHMEKLMEREPLQPELDSPDRWDRRHGPHQRHHRSGSPRRSPSNKTDENVRALSQKIDENARGTANRIDQDARGTANKTDQNTRGTADRADQDARGTATKSDHNVRVSSNETARTRSTTLDGNPRAASHNMDGNARLTTDNVAENARLTTTTTTTTDDADVGENARVGCSKTESTSNKADGNARTKSAKTDETGRCSLDASTAPSSPAVASHIPPFGMSLSPPPSRHSSPERRFGVFRSDKDDRVHRTDFATHSSSSLASSRNVSHHADPPRSSFESARPAGVKRRATNTISNALFSSGRRKSKDVGVGRFFKSGRIGDLVRTDSSRQSDAVRKLERQATDASSVSTLSDDEADTAALPPANKSRSATAAATPEEPEKERQRFNTPNLPSFVSRDHAAEDRLTSTVSDRHGRLRRGEGRSRFDRLAPPRIQLPTNDSAFSSNSARTGSPTASDDDRNDNVSPLDTLTPARKTRADVPGRQGRFRPTLSVSGSPARQASPGRRHWSISDRGQEKQVVHQVTPEDVAHVRALYLSSGIKACSIRAITNSTKDPPSDFLCAAAKAANEVPRAVKVREEHALAARLLSRTIAAGTSSLQSSLSSFRSQRLAQFHSRLDELRHKVDEKFTPLVHSTADEADAFAVELTTQHTLAVTQVNDAIDTMLRQRRRNLIFLQRASFTLLEWFLLALMWCVWFVVVIIRIFRRLVIGFGRGARWLVGL